MDSLYPLTHLPFCMALRLLKAYKTSLDPPQDLRGNEQNVDLPFLISCQCAGYMLSSVIVY